jgi:two-component system cell cycle sensor histidine kinase/response regulator CckA
MCPATSKPPVVRRTILLVDDDPSLRAVFTTTLEDHGFTVLNAKNADEALEVSRYYTSPIHLLLTDLMLPPKVRLTRSRQGQAAIHGLELMNKILAMRPGIQVILFSGQPDEVIEALGPIPEETTFLRKPFTLDTLIQKVCRVLDASEKK